MSKLPKLIYLTLLSTTVNATEFSGSPFDVRHAPLPLHLNTAHEKTIFVDPANHFYGAYNRDGQLIRWGIATTGAENCRDEAGSCKTKVGSFRIYSLGNENCTSSKYPSPTGGAPMPYCMFFVNGEAIHGSDDVQSANASHGCVRVHVSDAKWLRYKFVDAPSSANGYKGTRVIIGNYANLPLSSQDDDQLTPDANF